MASETNELTFVRCPTCRSLVPASASRCRICNATLEASGEKTPASDNAASPQGRVRQKTVTASPEEVKSFTAGEVEPPAATRPLPSQAAPVLGSTPPDSGESPAADDDAFDPLGAFLKDLDSDEVTTESSSSPGKSDRVLDDLVDDLFDDDDDEEDLASAPDNADDSDDFDLDIFDDPAFDELEEAVAGNKEPAPPAPAATPPASSRVEQQRTPPPSPPQQSKPQVADKREASPNAGAQGGPKPSRTEQSQPPRENKPAPPQPDPRRSPMQAGARNPQMGMRPRPSVQPPRQGAAQAAPPKQPAAADGGRTPQTLPQKAPPPQQQPVPRDAQKSRGMPANPEQRRASEPSASSPSTHVAKGRSPEPTRERAESSMQRSNPEKTQWDQPEQERALSGPKLGKMKPGRLFGWLVSFESPDGRAIELRSGRFFVTGTSIRGSDLILEDQSISTPHALMSINEKGFLLQDLMSERGTFVRSARDTQYRREESIIEVQHGDWIRFGDVEFLVTIVPG